MKKVSPRDKEVLAFLYESPSWKVFKRIFIEERQAYLAQQAVNAPSMDVVNQIKGAVVELASVEKAMKDNHVKNEADQNKTV